MQHLDIHIYGRVQGVGYRYFAKRLADKLGVNGYIRNEVDGSVYLEAEARAEVLTQFRESLKLGPNLSNVTKMQSNSGRFKGFETFEIN
jgi:acylphosphatase